MNNNIETKICTQCNIEKSLNAYYFRTDTNTYRNKCQECRSIKYKEKWQETLQNEEAHKIEVERSRKKYYRLNYKEIQKASPEKIRITKQKYRVKYPEKDRASYLAKIAISCDIGFDRHHWSYNVENAKDVIILSKKLHAKIHRFLKYDQAEMKYRTLEGILLNTKEEHYNYISQFFNEE